MKVLALSGDAGFNESVRAAVLGLAGVTEFKFWQGDISQQNVLPESNFAELLIVDCRTDAQEVIVALEALLPLYPGVQAAICTQSASPGLLMQAMRAGIQEVLAFPIQRHDVAALLQRLLQKKQVGARKQGQIISFLSCKGGSGATFLASNLAYSLANESNTRVLLIDLNLQFGDAALFVSDKRPPATLSDIAKDVQRIDLALLDSSIVNVLPNFGVLASPNDPAMASEIKPSQVEALLRFCRAHVDFVVLDLGRNIDSVVVQALDLSDQIYPVVQLTLPFIRDGKRLFDVFKSLDYPQDRIRLLVNRYEKTNSLQLSDVEQSLNCKVFRTIPNHWGSASDSINQGVPIVKLHKSSAISKSLVEFANQLKGGTVGSGSSWIKRFVSRA